MELRRAVRDARARYRARDEPHLGRFRPRHGQPDQRAPLRQVHGRAARQQVLPGVREAGRALPTLPGTAGARDRRGARGRDHRAPRRRHSLRRPHQGPPGHRPRQPAHGLHRDRRGHHRAEAGREPRAHRCATCRRALAGIQNVRSALREALRAALLVEGIDCGAAFVARDGDGRPSWWSSAASTRPALEAFAEIAGGAGVRRRPEQRTSSRRLPAGRRRRPHTSTGARPIANLVVGSTVYPEMPASLRSGLQVLGATTGTAISRILAEQSRGDAIADLEAVIAASPLATWAVDGRGRITMWNRAAEKVFGWRAGRSGGQRPPVGTAPRRRRRVAGGGAGQEGRPPRGGAAVDGSVSATWWATIRR